MKLPAFDQLEYVIIRVAALVLLLCAAARLVIHDIVALLR
jgi:hypothetical protein